MQNAHIILKNFPRIQPSMITEKVSNFIPATYNEDV